MFIKIYYNFSHLMEKGILKAVCPAFHWNEFITNAQVICLLIINLNYVRLEMDVFSEERKRKGIASCG